jgi:hypothetical protein
MKLARPIRWHRHRSSLRWGAVTMLVFALAGQVSTLAHLALVKHAVCLEHGELIHAAEHAQPSTARAPTRSESARVLLQTRDGEEASTHADEHCTVTAHRRAQAVFRAAPSVHVRLAAMSPAGLARPQAVRAFGRTVFHFAPKCSPPA